MKLSMSQHKHQRTLLAKIALFLMVMLMTFNFVLPASAAGFTEAAVPVAAVVLNADSQASQTLENSSDNQSTSALSGFNLLNVSTYGATIPALAAATTHVILSSHINTNVDIDNLFGGIVDIINKIAFYVGAILVVGGIFSLILAYKDENADQQARSIRNIVVGVSLMTLPVFLQMAGIIS